MKDKAEKITTKQALFLFLILAYTPMVRIVAGHSASEAKQAAWLTPIVGFFIVIPLVLIISKFYKKYKSESMFYIICDIMGSFLGKVIITVYIIWITILVGLYLRYFGERLAGSIYVDIDIPILIAILLVVILLVLRGGITIIGRMGEIMLPIITIIFVALFILLISQIDIKNLTPISYMDIMPVIRGSASDVAIWSYIFIVFLAGDKITDKENIKKYGIYSMIFVAVAGIMIIVSTVGNLGHTLIGRAPQSYLISVKEISLFELFERIESILVTTWIISDFIIVTMLIFIALEGLKKVLNFNDAKPLLSIYTVLGFILSLYISNSLFELQAFSNNILIQANIILLLILPIIIFGIGKVRQKV